MLGLTQQVLYSAIPGCILLTITTINYSLITIKRKFS